MSRTSTLAALGAGFLIAAAAGAPAATVLFQNAGNEHGMATATAHRADASQHESDVTTPESTASPEATPSLPPCPADVANHGEYVSSVAQMNHGKTGEHGKPAASDFTHGELVSLAAQSDCGKPEGASADTDADTDATESAEPDSHSAGPHGKSGQEHGKSGSHIPGQAPSAP